MDIIIGFIIVGLAYAMYRAYQPKPTVTETAVPYKVEAPVQESAPAVAPAKEVTTDASPPAKTRKVPAKKAAAPKAKAAVKKPAPAKKPTPAKKPAKPKK